MIWWCYTMICFNIIIKIIYFWLKLYALVCFFWVGQFSVCLICLFNIIEIKLIYLKCCSVSVATCFWDCQSCAIVDWNSYCTNFALKLLNVEQCNITFYRLCFCLIFIKFFDVSCGLWFQYIVNANCTPMIWELGVSVLTLGGTCCFQN